MYEVTANGLELSPATFTKVASAISSIRKGSCARVDVHKDIKVYAVKNVIRVDIKMG